jgi:hypothetical protein
MVYILKQSGRIVGFGETPFVTGEGQTQETFDGTLAGYAGRFRLVANKTSIIANGTDEAIVTLHSNVGAGSIDVAINDLVVVVSISNGQGTLPTITSDVAGSITVKPADETLYSAAGEGQVRIVAQEEQS